MVTEFFTRDITPVGLFSLFSLRGQAIAVEFVYYVCGIRSSCSCWPSSCSWVFTRITISALTVCVSLFSAR